MVYEFGGAKVGKKLGKWGVWEAENGGNIRFYEILDQKQKNI
jgi:hypothetical protein